MATWLAILIGGVVRVGGWLFGRLVSALARDRVRCSHEVGNVHRTAALVILGFALTLPGVADAQGWWWGSPVNPGFDRNTVIQVTGTATQVDIVSRGGPSTLRLDTADESFTVMLAPGWFLAELRADIRDGDPLIVEGSKMMDRRGNLHLVAARITNQRTGSVLELRDEMGRPRWMGGRPWGNGR